MRGKLEEELERDSVHVLKMYYVNLSFSFIT